MLVTVLVVGVVLFVTYLVPGSRYLRYYDTYQGTGMYISAFTFPGKNLRT